jgi:hypothetical protein
MQQNKVQALTDWPRLTKVTEVQSFLGLSNYTADSSGTSPAYPHHYQSCQKRASRLNGGEDRRILFRTSNMQSKAPQCCSWRIIRNRTPERATRVTLASAQYCSRKESMDPTQSPLHRGNSPAPKRIIPCMNGSCSP